MCRQQLLRLPRRLRRMSPEGTRTTRWLLCWMPTPLLAVLPSGVFHRWLWFEVRCRRNVLCSHRHQTLPPGRGMRRWWRRMGRRGRRMKRWLTGPRHGVQRQSDLRRVVSPLFLCSLTACLLACLAAAVRSSVYHMVYFYAEMKSVQCQQTSIVCYSLQIFYSPDVCLCSTEFSLGTELCSFPRSCAERAFSCGCRPC